MASAQFKRKRSDTIPGPPKVREAITLKNPTCNYWEQRLAQTVTYSGVDPSQVDFGFIPIILGFLTEVQTEYTKRISFVEDQLELEENVHKSTKSLLDQVTWKVKTITSNREPQQIEPLLSPMPALTKRQRKGQDPITRTGPLPPKTSGSTPPSPPPQGPGARGEGKKKKKTTPSAKPAPTAPTPTTSTKAPPPKKGLSLRER